MVKKKFTDAEVERARKRLKESIALVGSRGFLTGKQVKSLQKKLKK